MKIPMKKLFTYKKPEESVDWEAYAREYDLLAEANSAYRDLLEFCMKTVAGWNLPKGAAVLDIGAGTGNFSVRIAQMLPNVTVLHLDSSAAMNATAQRKAKAAKVNNWQLLNGDIDALYKDLPPVDAVVCIHALYPLPDPLKTIGRMCSVMQPGGYVFAADVGRPLHIFEWAIYLVRCSLLSRGVIKTLRLILNTRTAKRVNRQISRLQRDGFYWSHGLAEFSEAFRREGIRIIYSSDNWYRGYDDVITGRKINNGASN